MKRDKLYIKRKIYFYRIHAGLDLTGKPIQYDIKKVLENINNLSFQDEARYLKGEDGFEICCWIDDLSAPQKVRFGKIKRDNLPQFEHRGTLGDLPIAEEDGLAECVHAVFFSDNIVGLEYNYEGPRITSISDYLYTKSKNVCSRLPVFETLLQQDVLKKLERMKTIRKFRLKVRESLFSSVQQADIDLAHTFQSARQLGQAHEIELALSVGRGRGTLGTKVFNMSKRLLMFRDDNSDVVSGEIKGYDENGHMEIIDLLNAKFVVEKRIPRSQTRTSVPQSECVYAAINEAYEVLKDQLIIALGVTSCPV